MNKLLQLKDCFLIVCFLCMQLVFGQTETITVNLTSIGGTAAIGSTSYGATVNEFTLNGVQLGSKYLTGNGSNIQAQGNNGLLFNISELPGRLVSVKLTATNSSSTTLYGGDSKLVNSNPSTSTTPTGTSLGSISNTSSVWTVPAGTNYRFFALKKGSGAGQWSKVEITYETTVSTEPALNVSASTLTLSSFEQGTMPTSTSANITGANLEGTETLSVTSSDPNFEVTLDGGAFAATATSANYTGEGKTLSVRINAAATAGIYNTTLTVQVGSLSKTITVSGEVTAPIVRPANDLCANAIELAFNAPATSGTLLNSTYSNSFQERDIWYKYVATHSGPHTITVGGFNGDIDFDVYENTCPTSDEEIFDYQGSYDNPEVLETNLVEGNTYYIRLYAYNNVNTGSNSPITISVTGEIPVPAISYAGPFEFTATVGQNLSGNVLVTGEYLTAPILFGSPTLPVQSVSTSGNTATAATAQLTFDTTALGTFTGSFIAFSGDVQVTVPVTLTVTLPTPVATAATAVSHNGFTANWNGVAGAENYILNVYEKIDSFATVVNEDFAASTANGGNSGGFSTSSGTAVGNLFPGWTFQNSFLASSCVRVGSGSLGTATTPVFGQEGSGIISFRAGAWGTDNITLKISLVGAGTLSQTTVTMVRGAFSTYEISFTGANASTRLKFEGQQASNSRFFLDDVVITMGASALNLVQGPFYTSSTSYEVEGLNAETDYAYNVVATAGTLETQASNTIEVTTAADPAFTVGAITANVVDCAAQTAELEITGLVPNEEFAVVINSTSYVYTASATGVITFAGAEGTNTFVVSTITRVSSNYEVQVNETFTVDFGTVQTYYVDMDGDGYGDDSLPTIQSCYPVQGYALVAGDCNDNAFGVNPGTAEVLYNGIDDNCDGNLDEGFQKTTKLIAAHCGSMMEYITSSIFVGQVQGATAYRFKVENLTTNETNYVVSSVRYFYLTDLEMGATFGTTYRVSAEVQYMGIWLGYYGEECLISSPPVIVDGANGLTTCDTQLEKFNSIIYGRTRAGVTTYRFRFTHYDESGEPVVEIVDRPRHWVMFSTIQTAKYGTAYTVEIAMKTANGEFSEYGAPCVIMSPELPAFASCDVEATSKNTLFYTAAKLAVSSYRYELTNLNTYEVLTIVRPYHYFAFSNLPSFELGAPYAVRVSVMTNGNWSPYGYACNIQAPMTMGREQLVAKAFEVVAYPTVYTDSFRLQLSLPTQEEVSVVVYDQLGRQLDNRVVAAQDAEYATFGKNVPAGIYYVVVSQGSATQTVRVVKN